MSQERLLYIENSSKEKLYYRFTPTLISSNFIPLIVILQDVDEELRLNFEYKMWNVLTPLYDKKAPKEDLLKELIEKILQECEVEEHLYICGDSSMSYETMYYGTQCHANAIYIEASQPVLQKSLLATLEKGAGEFPDFYLCVDDKISKSEKEQLEEMSQKKGMKINLDFCPKAYKNEEEKIKKVLDMLEKFS